MKRYLLAAVTAAFLGGSTITVLANQAGAQAGTQTETQAGMDTAALLAQIEITYSEEERQAAMDRSLRLHRQVKDMFTGDGITVKESYLGYVEFEAKGKSVGQLMTFLEQGLNQMGVEMRSVKDWGGHNYDTDRQYAGRISFEGDRRGIIVYLKGGEAEGYSIEVYLNRGTVIPSNQEQLSAYIRKSFTSAEVREVESGIAYLNVMIDGGEGADEKMKAFCTSAMKSLGVIDLNYPNPFMTPGGDVYKDPADTRIMIAQGHIIYDHDKRNIIATIRQSPEDGAVTMDITYEVGPPSLALEFVEQLFETDYLRLDPLGSCMAEPGAIYMVCEEQDKAASLAKIESVFEQLGARKGEYMGTGPDMPYLVYGSNNRILSCYEYQDQGQWHFDIRY